MPLALSMDDHVPIAITEGTRPERSAILGAQAALAEDLYRGDRQLTDFEAFGEEDLHGDGPHTEEG